jgi:hypothetical protein
MIATVVALGLTGLLLLGMLAFGIFAVARVGDRMDDRRQAVSDLRSDRWDLGDPGERMGPGDRGNGMGQGGRGSDGLPGGNGLLRRLGGVEHGEFTVTGADGKAVVMTVQRGAVTAASATSLAVRSDDGFAQTYVVNAATRVLRGAAADLAAGDDVVVVARKEGKVAVQVWRSARG